LLSLLAAASIVLVDRSEAAGIRFQNVFGSADKRFIYETLGSGAAFVDYDEDGLLDGDFNRTVSFEFMRERLGGFFGGFFARRIFLHLKLRPAGSA